MTDNVKKKILFIITKSNWGGAQRYVFDLATNLDKKIFDVSVACGGNGPLVEKLSASGIRIVPVKSLERDVWLIKDCRAIIEIWKILRQEAPELLHLNSSKVGAIGAPLARLYNIVLEIETLFRRIRSLISQSKQSRSRPKLKTVFTAHGWAFNEPRPPIERLVIRLISLSTICASHGVIVISQKERGQALSLINCPNKIHLIYNGVKEREDDTEQSVARSILSRDKDSISRKQEWWIGSVGELHKNKGFNYAIDAMSEIISLFPTARLMIVGEGEKQERLVAQIKKRGLEKNISLIGQVDNASSLFRAFDIFLICSVKEGLPYVLLEAGIKGLPTVATDVGGMGEVIVDMENGILIQSKNHKEIARAIIYLLKNRCLREKFGKALYEKIRSKFSLGEMVTQTTYLYQKVHAEKINL